MMIGLTKCFVLLGIVSFSYEVSAQCRFTKQQVEKTKRIMTSMNEDGKLELIRTDIVPPCTRIYMICNDNDIVTAMCKRNSVWSRSLPVAICDDPIIATVKKDDDDTICPYQMYLVGYKLADGTFLELYKTCYKKDAMRPFMTMHALYYFSVSSERPSIPFRSDGMFESEETDSYLAPNIYERYRTLLGVGQRFIRSKTDNIIDHGHLVPAGDFMFNNNKRATFLMVNCFPQYSDVNQRNWLAVENWVRRRRKTTAVIDIITGVIGVLQLKNKNGVLTDMYLLKDFKNPIPKWLYKIIIENRVVTVVFITYNNDNDDTCPPSPCTRVDCPADINFRGEAVDEDPLWFGMTVCCDPNTFTKDISGYKAE